MTIPGLCSECRHFEPLHEFPGYGRCHFMPPQNGTQRDPVAHEFPRTKLTDWCAQFKTDPAE